MHFVTALTPGKAVSCDAPIKSLLYEASVNPEPRSSVAAVFIDTRFVASVCSARKRKLAEDVCGFIALTLLMR